ncbi:LysM peptidoglycan-binding domain-containing protein [Bacillus sp. CGMCC 1.16541]|uniref:LysM peptidoglycan-binding domain-containing protein n=1 Tax=Bacillus sp. CGMCC 1.16541 TaxID=2185143 RepID=UPI000D73DE3C|nr:LysM peptidoglycan-binding domain-containing protein [Bacillus sp. CGMCC 1.16541]
MISIKHKGGVFIFPVSPGTAGYTGGGGKYEDVSVLRIGTVPFFNGTELKEFSWTSFFPASPSYFTEEKAKFDPLASKKLMEKLRDKGEVVLLMIPDIDISMKVQVRSFEPNQVKPGDIDYSIKLTEYREIKLKETKVSGSSKPKKGISNPGRSPAPKKTQPKTYTIKKGDTLSHIAKRLGLSSWKPLYDKNKKVIGSNPNLIKPGQVLKV